MWQYINSSTIGASHIKVGLPCQDAHQIIAKENVLIVALADGLGTASLSDTGATLAVSTAIAELESQDITLENQPTQWTKLIENAFIAAQDALRKEAESASKALREYNTTLIVGIVHPTIAVVGHLGDGAVIVQTNTSQLLPLSWPHNEEYVNEVTPLTHATALESVHYKSYTDPIDGVAFLTDGLQTLALEFASGEPYQPFFTPFFDLLSQPVERDSLSSQLDQFLQSERVCQKTDDDKTLVIARWLPDIEESINIALS